MLVSHRSKRFEGSLYDALRADVNPTTRSHLAVHHQAFALEFMKVIPVGPGAHQIGIRDQDTRRIFMCAKDSNRFSRLHQQRLIVLQLMQRPNNRVERFPIARSFTRATVDDQFIRLLCHFGIEIVHQTAQRCFLMPAFAVEFGAAGRTDRS